MASLWERYWAGFSLMGSFLLITILYYWPLAVNLNGHFADLPLGDKGTNLWNLWWVYYAIFELHTSPLWCDLLYYPWGVDLRYHTLSLTNGILAAPITAMWGPNAAYNILFLVWTVLTGFFAGLWARRFGVSFWGALLVGLVAAIGPYRTSHEIHLNLFSTHWLFISFWWLEICLERNRIWHWLLFTLLWLLATFSSFYYALFIGVYWAVRLLVWCWFRFPFRFFHEYPWKAEIPLLVVFLCLIMFYLAPHPPRDIQPDDVSFSQSIFWSLDFMQLIFPHSMINFLEELFQINLVRPVSTGPEFNLHPGMHISMLVLIAIFACRKIRWNYEHLATLLFVMGVFWVFSLGPVLKFRGIVDPLMGYPIILPALAIEAVPTLSSLRVYSRFAYIGFVVFALFGAYGMDLLVAKFRLSAIKIFILIFIFLCQFLFTANSFMKDMYEYEVPRIFNEPIQGPVFEIPIEPTQLSGLHLYHQTVHHQPIYVAEFSRLQSYRQRYLREFSTLISINKLARNELLHVEDSIDSEYQSKICAMANELEMANIIYTPEPNSHVERKYIPNESMLENCNGVRFLYGK